MRRSSLAFLLVAGACLGAPVQAQLPVASAPTVELALVPVAGLSALAGDQGDVFDPSYCLGGEIDVRIGDLLAATGTVVYNRFTPKFVSAAVTDNAQFIEFGFGGKYVVVPTPVARPYIRAGLGLYRRDTGGDETETNFGLNGGAGVDIDPAGSRLGFTAAARFHNIFVSNASWKYFNLYGGVRFSVI